MERHSALLFSWVTFGSCVKNDLSQKLYMNILLDYTRCSFVFTSKREVNQTLCGSSMNFSSKSNRWYIRQQEKLALAKHAMKESRTSDWSAAKVIHHETNWHRRVLLNHSTLNFELLSAAQSKWLIFPVCCQNERSLTVFKLSPWRYVSERNRKFVFIFKKKKNFRLKFSIIDIGLLLDVVAMFWNLGLQ